MMKQKDSQQLPLFELDVKEFEHQGVGKGYEGVGMKIYPSLKSEKPRWTHRGLDADRAPPIHLPEV